MSCQLRKPKRFYARLCVFLLMLFLSLSVVCTLHLISTNYLMRHQLPCAQEGSIDLSTVDFSKTPYIPLTKQWKFYPNTFLNSTFFPVGEQSFLTDAPSRQTANYGSYQLQIQNFPAGENLCIYLPHQPSGYRIYWNRYLVSTNVREEKASENFSSTLVELNRLAVPDNHAGSLVIEVEGRFSASLLSAPILMRMQFYQQSANINSTFSGLSYGVSLFFLAMYVALCISTGKTFRSYYLLIILIYCSMIFSVRDNTGSLATFFLPFLRSRMVAQIHVVAMCFFPLFLLLYGSELLVSRLSRITRMSAVLLCTASATLSALAFLYPASYFKLSNLSLLLTCIVLFMVFAFLGKCVLYNAPYSLLCASSFLLLLTGLAVDYCSAQGYFVFGTSAWFPLFFVVMLLELVFLYQQKVLHLQREAQQAQQNALAVSQMQLKVQQSEAALMLSQIRPHFLYNALLAIRDVNNESQAAANQAILQFANYLRANIRSIGSDKPIPFADELRHIENYVSIEKLRFEDRLEMQYEIGTTAFCIPPLTVQPLVENAIKHGICQRLNGGYVRLQTYLQNETVSIVISDNGVGFDTHSSFLHADSIGISNVRTRLSALKGTALTIESSIDAGTTVTITLPQGGAPADE